MIDNENIENVVEDTAPVVEQEHANKIAQAAYARGVKSAENSLGKKIEALEALIKNSNSNYVDEEKIIREAEERAAARAKKEAEEMKDSERYKKLADNFNQKIQRGKENFDDFGEKVKKFNPTVYPRFAMAIAEMEDGEEVLYHLLDRGIKISQINQLLNEDPNSELAKDELRKVSDSAKKNKEAKGNFRATSAPLSKINPSNSGLGKDGVPSIENLKARGFYRF